MLMSRRREAARKKVAETGKKAKKKAKTTKAKDLNTKKVTKKKAAKKKATKKVMRKVDGEEKRNRKAQGLKSNNNYLKEERINGSNSQAKA